jgi:hypothetical protein
MRVTLGYPEGRQEMNWKMVWVGRFAALCYPSPRRAADLLVERMLEESGLDTPRQ